MVLPSVSRRYPSPIARLLTCYSPVRHYNSKSKLFELPFDLHVLGAPPAFVLSQDQTLYLFFLFSLFPNFSLLAVRSKLLIFFSFDKGFYSYLLLFIFQCSLFFRLSLCDFYILSYFFLLVNIFFSLFFFFFTLFVWFAVKLNIIIKKHSRVV